jgi:hypothetical protein
MSSIVLPASAVLFDALVQLVGIGGVMLVVMKLHRLLVDHRLERVIGVRQRRKFESHQESPS